MDLGAKKNICRELQKRGCDVTVVPYNTTAEQIMEMHPDGIMLSNGPGDPAENVDVIREIRKLMNSGIPMFGICLGHQLIAFGCRRPHGKNEIRTQRCKSACQET